MIQVRHVTKFYGKVKALQDVSLQVTTPEPVVILGPSGSGKSTLLRLIAGLEVPDAGEIRINGGLVSRPGWVLPPHLRNMGFVFQAPALWPHMTVEGNITFGMDGVSQDRLRGRLRELLDDFDLHGLGKRYPDELSGGEARRVAIARCLAPEPRYLLMDEPLTNLDRERKWRALERIAVAVRETGAFLVYVTHDPEEARKLSRRVIFLDSGRIVEAAPGKESPLP
ncbi:MAG: ABC transporter ATP-binding protein [Geobacteraceae bacterium]|nr:ABC transporter ATP-binding protein [Geobacteraceae bacterium]